MSSQDNLLLLCVFFKILSFVVFTQIPSFVAVNYPHMVVPLCTQCSSGFTVWLFHTWQNVYCDNPGPSHCFQVTMVSDGVWEDLLLSFSSAKNSLSFSLINSQQKYSELCLCFLPSISTQSPCLRKKLNKDLSGVSICSGSPWKNVSVEPGVSGQDVVWVHAAWVT